MEPRVRFNIEPGSGVAVGTCSGVLALADATAAAGQVWQRADWNRRAIVWDFREGRLDFSNEDVRMLARFILENQPAPPPARVGIVTARDVDFGMARVFEALRESPGTEVRVFRDFEEALAWARSKGEAAG